MQSIWKVVNKSRCSGKIYKGKTWKFFDTLISFIFFVFKNKSASFSIKLKSWKHKAYQRLVNIFEYKSICKKLSDQKFKFNFFYFHEPHDRLQISLQAKQFYN